MTKHPTPPLNPDPPSVFGACQPNYSMPRSSPIEPLNPRNPEREALLRENAALAPSKEEGAVHSVGFRAQPGGWQRATKAHIRQKSATEEQRRQPPRPAARPPVIFSKHPPTKAHRAASVSHGEALLPLRIGLVETDRAGSLSLGEAK